MDWLIDKIGYAVCHQMPERTLVINGRFLPVDARDTGLYLGFFFSFVFLMLTHRERESEPPPTYLKLLAFLFIGAMIFDGVTSYLGWRETTNLIRLVTGLFAGASFSLFLMPLLNESIWQVVKVKPIMKSKWQVIVWFSLLVFIFLALFFDFPYLGFLPLSIAISIIFTITSVNLAVITQVNRWQKRARKVGDLTVPLLLSLLLTAVELFGGYNLHAWIDGKFGYF
jgi:uncharacterized membrane protein